MGKTAGGLSNRMRGAALAGARAEASARGSAGTPGRLGASHDSSSARESQQQQQQPQQQRQPQQASAQAPDLSDPGVYTCTVGDRVLPTVAVHSGRSAKWAGPLQARDCLPKAPVGTPLHAYMR